MKLERILAEAGGSVAVEITQYDHADLPVGRAETVSVATVQGEPMIELILLHLAEDGERAWALVGRQAYTDALEGYSRIRYYAAYDAAVRFALDWTQDCCRVIEEAIQAWNMKQGPLAGEVAALH